MVLGTTVLGNASSYTRPEGGLVIGGTLPSNSNGEGEPEPINSLPRGFDNGEPGLARQQAVQHYWATHE